MYAPTSRNGTPHNLKNRGECWDQTVTFQNTTKPHHSRLKGIKKTSRGRKRNPSIGCPCQNTCSPTPSCRRIASGMAVVDAYMMSSLSRDGT